MTPCYDAAFDDAAPSAATTRPAPPRLHHTPPPTTFVAFRAAALRHAPTAAAPPGLSATARPTAIALSSAAGYALGEWATSANRSPETAPAKGSVKSHPKVVHATILQFTARTSPAQSPTPTVAPQMQCVVETDVPVADAQSTVVRAASSIENPREGEW